MSDHPCNTVAPCSETEGCPVNNPEVDTLIEDNILKKTILVVCDVVCILLSRLVCID
jgi:hypothetical protein